MQVRLFPPLLLWVLGLVSCDNGGSMMPGTAPDGGAQKDQGKPIPCETDDDCDEETDLRACKNHVCGDAGCPAGMTYVGAGAFIRGCDPSDKDCQADSQPAQQVTLTQGFCIGRTELTVGQYRACVTAGRCTAPPDLICTDSATWTPMPGKNELLPLNCMYHSDALFACAFGGGRLPTEAEWEKAARGRDKRKYPWGNTAPADCLRGVNWAGPSGCDEQPWLVGSGKGLFARSESQAQDMAGNVWEWIADWYAPDAYAKCGADCTDPKGPQSGVVRVRRGGSFRSMLLELRASYREFHTPEQSRSDMHGVRCAQGVPGR